MACAPAATAGAVDLHMVRERRASARGARYWLTVARGAVVGPGAQLEPASVPAQLLRCASWLWLQVRCSRPALLSLASRISGV